MNLKDLINIAVDKADAELNTRLQANEAERVGILGAAEGIKFFIGLLMEELKSVGRAEGEDIQHQGPDSGDQQDVEPQKSGEHEQLDKCSVELAESISRYSYRP